MTLAIEGIPLTYGCPLAPASPGVPPTPPPAAPEGSPCVASLHKSHARLAHVFVGGVGGGAVTPVACPPLSRNPVVALGAQPPHAASRENVPGAREIHSRHRTLVDATMVCMTSGPDPERGRPLYTRRGHRPTPLGRSAVPRDLSSRWAVDQPVSANRGGGLGASTRGPRHRAAHGQQHADIERTLDLYRALIFGEELPPDQPIPSFQPKELHDMWWKGLERRGKFLGLDAPHSRT